jgi:L-amino acid N-acyltransferase YncA
MPSIQLSTNIIKNMIIRFATCNDLPKIIEIYNQAIDAGFRTADIYRVTIEERLPWFGEHSPERYPLLVCEIDGIVVGWLSVSPYRPGRMALRFTVEVSYYVHADYQRRGIAGALIADAIEKSRSIGYKTMFAIVLDCNAASCALLEKYGFEKWGFMPGVADFNGVECGHVYYGKRLCG